MHFRRTFVEKMFALHAKVEIFKRDGRPIGTYARHYYDIFCLLHQLEVTDMLASDEYADIKRDYKAVSETSFPRDYFEPEGMSFASSDALFPPASIHSPIEADYQTQCSNLCYDVFPKFDEVLNALAAVRDRL